MIQELCSGHEAFTFNQSKKTLLGTLNVLLGRSSLLRGASNSHTRLTSDSQLRTCVNRKDIIKCYVKLRNVIRSVNFLTRLRNLYTGVHLRKKVNCPRDPGAYCPTAATMGTTRTKTVIVTVFPTAVNFLPHFFFLRCDLWSLNSSGELQFVPIQALTSIIMVS